jgi:hypothetical protein
MAENRAQAVGACSERRRERWESELHPLADSDSVVSAGERFRVELLDTSPIAATRVLACEGVQQAIREYRTRMRMREV